MKLKITRYTFLWITIMMIGLVAMSYMLYILDMSPSFHILLVFMRIVFATYLIIVVVWGASIINKDTIFPICFMLYAFLISSIQGRLSIVMVYNIVTWPLIYLLSYLYALKTNNWKNDSTKLKRLLVVFVVILALFSFPLISRHLMGLGRGGEVIFPVYYFLTIVPLIMLISPKSKSLRIISAILILLTTKRAGILIVCIGNFLSLIMEYYCSGNLRQKLQKLLRIVLVVSIAIIGGMFIIQSLELDVIERFLSISVDSGSGRINIWKNVWRAFCESNFLKVLFGHGYEAVIDLQLQGRSILAHSDYLELLYDYGIIGFTFVILWLVQIANRFITLYKEKSKFVSSYAYMLSCLIVLSLFSYCLIQSYIMNFLACYLGLIFGFMKRKNKDDIGVI